MSAINLENRMKVNIQHSKVQKSLKCMKLSSSLADALCHRTSIQELILMDKTIISNACFTEGNQRTVDSKIEKVFIDSWDLHKNDRTASRGLAKFLCHLSCLTDLTIKDADRNVKRIYFHDDFYHEIARLASSSKIEKVFIDGWDLHKNDRTASRDLAKFLCHLPCLTDLTIKDVDRNVKRIYFHDDFYHEIARLASSSKIEKVCIDGFSLHTKNGPTASRDLAKFLCLLPCLTDLTIKYSDSKSQYIYFHDDFYHELARLASSSKIEKVCIDGCDLLSIGLTASRELAKILCLLPCLTDLTIKPKYLHDDFYHGIARLASSSKVITFYLFPLFSKLYVRLSCQSPYFMDKKHTRMLENYWTAREWDRPSCSGSDMPSTSSYSGCSGCCGCTSVEDEQIPGHR
eukprot:XP_011660368.1 PREDICTED: uncharacterized protein LOC105436483 [Strongylocentrotus purpuratus]